MKIAIFGKMCSGKSTLFKFIQFYLESTYQMKLKKVSFADKIYEIAYDLFKMKEKDRKLLQDIGQKMREIDENIFTKYTLDKYEEEDIIIEDCRLLSEFGEIQKRDFIKIRIHITEEYQKERLKKCYPDTWEEHMKNLNHRSETELLSLEDSEFNLILKAEDQELNYEIVKKYIDTLFVKKEEYTINEEEIISGEKIQKLCDVYMGTHGELSFNPKVRDDEKIKINFDTFHNEEEWDNPLKIFCYSNQLELFMKKMDKCKNPFVLIAHNSDGEVEERHREILKNPKLIHMWSQNVLIDDTKISVLPIGIANSMWNHGNLSLFKQVMDMNIKKERDIYFQFSMHTHVDRQRVYKICKEKLLFEEVSRPYKDYLIRLGSYRFCICPRGNGIDTHRFWECIYLNVIPIVEENTFNRKWKIKYPQIIMIQRFEEMDVDKILRGYQYPNFHLPRISEIKEEIETFLRESV